MTYARNNRRMDEAEERNSKFARTARTLNVLFPDVTVFAVAAAMFARKQRGSYRTLDGGRCVGMPTAPIPALPSPRSTGRGTEGLAMVTGAAIG